MTKEEDMKRDEGFTPGPWEVATSYDEEEWTEGDQVLTRSWPITTIRTVRDSKSSDGVVGWELAREVWRESDARLIAAAPDLLDALQQLWAWTAGEIADDTPLGSKVRKAIAKATPHSLSAAERNER